MSSKKRKTLVDDNCAAHLQLNLTNINIVLSITNCTSVMKPMDQGVIRSLKYYYHKELIETYFHMDIAQPVNVSSVLDAIQFIDRA